MKIMMTINSMRQTKSPNCQFLGGNDKFFLSYHLSLLTGQQVGHPACTCMLQQSQKVLLWLIWSNSRKVGWLNKNSY